MQPQTNVCAGSVMGFGQEEPRAWKFSVGCVLPGPTALPPAQEDQVTLQSVAEHTETPGNT